MVDAVRSTEVVSWRRCEMIACPGRSAARSTCEAVRCRAGAVTNSGVWYGPGSAERHEGCRTASGTRERVLRQYLPPLAQPGVDLGAFVVQQSLVGRLDHVEQLVGVAEPRHHHIVGSRGVLVRDIGQHVGG